MALIITFSACKKEHTCSCSSPLLPLISVDTVLTDISKKDAEAKCEGFSEEGLVECKLK